MEVVESGIKKLVPQGDFFVVRPAGTGIVSEVLRAGHTAVVTPAPGRKRGESGSAVGPTPIAYASSTGSSDDEFLDEFSDDTAALLYPEGRPNQRPPASARGQLPNPKAAFRPSAQRGGAECRDSAGRERGPGKGRGRASCYSASPAVFGELLQGVWEGYDSRDDAPANVFEAVLRDDALQDQRKAKDSAGTAQGRGRGGRKR